MTVAAHQKNGNEHMARESQKKQSTDFTETECYPSVVVQRVAYQKNGCMSGVPEVTGTSGRPRAISPSPNGAEGHTTMLRRLLIGAALTVFEIAFSH